MYKNNCIKCGVEFETKNPKRVICPACLYPDRQEKPLQSYDNTLKQPAEEQPPTQEPKKPGYYVSGESHEQRRPPQQGGYQGQQGGGFRRPRPQQDNYNQGGYNRPQQGGYRQDGYRQDRQGGYNRPQQGGYNQGGYNRPQQGGYRNDGYRQQGGYNNRPQQGGYNQGGYNRGPRPGGPGGFRRPQQGGMQRRPAANRQLLVSREQVAEIENLYRAMLPLPNPDCHEVIGEKIELEPNKVFFGINLVRQKLKLPKLPYPKRKLAVSADQLMAIQNLYSPLLPLPPIGCHKIIAKQLKIDEWRVHVGIGIIRKQMDLPRWNAEREDAPEEFKNQPQSEEAPVVEEASIEEKPAAEENKAEEAPSEEKEEKAEEKKSEKKTTKKKATKKEDKEEKTEE